MKFLKCIIIFLCLITIPIYGNKTDKPSEIYIIQDGKETKIKSNTVTIKKNEFSFKFILHNNPDMRILISDNDNIYKAALNNIDQIYLFPFFVGSSFAEDNLNKTKDIILSDTGNHYWYYTDKDDSRFDSVKVEDNKFTCIRIVKNIYDIESKKLINISKIKPKVLYVTILRNTGDLTNKPINFNTILNDKKSKYYDFVKWAHNNNYIDTSFDEDEFLEEIERICFRIVFK